MKTIFTILLFCLSVVPPAMGGTVFDGSDYIQVSHHNDLVFSDGESISISFYVRVTGWGSSSDRHPVITKRDATYNDYYIGLKTVSADGKVRFFYRDTSGNPHTYDTASTPVNAGNWYHIGFTYTYGTGSSAKTYVNGVEQIASWTNGTGNGVVKQTTNDIYIGKDNALSKYFYGEIEDMNIYSRILSESEIKNHASYIKYMNEEIPTALASWPLDDFAYNVSGGGDTYRDISGNGHTGTGTAGGGIGLTSLGTRALTFRSGQFFINISEEGFKFSILPSEFYERVGVLQ